MIALRSMFRVAALGVLPALVGAGMPIVRAAEEKPVAKEAKAAPEAKAKKAPADYRGPLPFYYGKVVSPDQKEKIYAIQQKYEGELKSLMAKVKELQAARDKEIDGVLSPEQLKRVEELRTEAKTKAAAKTDGAKKPAEGEAKKEKPEAGK